DSVENQYEPQSRGDPRTATWTEREKNDDVARTNAPDSEARDRVVLIFKAPRGACEVHFLSTSLTQLQMGAFRRKRAAQRDKRRRSRNWMLGIVDHRIGGRVVGGELLAPGPTRDGHRAAVDPP